MKKLFLYTILASSFTFFNACQNPKETIETKNKNLKNTTISEVNSLEIFVFHGTNQCVTCKNIKANTKATLATYFKNELEKGTIIFNIIDVDDPQNEQIAQKFEATGTALMINKIRNGNDSIVDLSDFAFEFANNAQEYNPKLKEKITELLKP